MAVRTSKSEIIRSAAVPADFAATATYHMHDIVQRLTLEHERIVASLWQENMEMLTELGKTMEKSDSDGWQRLKPSFERPELHIGDSQHEQHGQVPEVENSTSDVNGIEVSLQWADGNILPSPSESHHVLDHSVEEGALTEQHSASTPKAKERMASISEHARQISWLGKVVQALESGKFDTVVGSIIVANTLIMSLQLEYRGRVFEDEIINKCVHCQVHSQTIESFFSVSEHFFTAVFAVELFLRLLLEGHAYLRSFSNFFDAIVVVVSMADSWILGPMGSDVMGSVAVIRLLRLMRLAKILRVVRVMKAFRSLRVLVSAVVNSVGALGWSMTLLFVLELVGAIFLAQVIQPFMEESDDEELQQFIFKHFGTWTNSMLTVFEITMAPGGFIQYRRLYEDVHAFFGIFMAVYVCVVTFAVVRVITAMFLKATLSASDNDEKVTAMEKSKEWTDYVRSLQDRAELQTVGMLSFSELEDLLKLEHFSHWLEDVGLEPDEVIRIFMSLDQGSRQVLFSEFEAALRQMRGLPRSADIVINLYETRNIMLRVMKMESLLEERFPIAGAPQGADKELAPMECDRRDNDATTSVANARGNIVATAIGSSSPRVTSKALDSNFSAKHIMSSAKHTMSSAGVVSAS